MGVDWEHTYYHAGGLLNCFSFQVIQSSMIIARLRAIACSRLAEESKRAVPGKYGIHICHLLQLMLFYGVTTYVVLAVTCLLYTSPG